MANTSNTNKAFRLHSYGGPETIQLDDVAIPTPGKSQVLVEISMVGMNPFDWKLREGYVKDVMPLSLPVILGADFMGKVVAVGEGANRFVPGDRVMTISTSLGAFAEHIAVDEQILAKVPSDLNDATAATLPMPALTAWQTLYFAGDIKKGARILIHGASGTTGAFAVQFAKAAGAVVIGTASGKNRSYVLSLGADEFIDYQTQKFEDHVKDIDLVLDYVLIGGTDNTNARSWNVLAPDGKIVSAADPSVVVDIPEGRQAFWPAIRPDPAMLEAIAAKVASGKIQSKVAQVFPREELVTAMEINKAGGTTGRLLVDFKQVK